MVSLLLDAGKINGLPDVSNQINQKNGLRMGFESQSHKSVNRILKTLVPLPKQPEHLEFKNPMRNQNSCHFKISWLRQYCFSSIIFVSFCIPGSSPISVFIWNENAISLFKSSFSYSFMSVGLRGVYRRVHHPHGKGKVEPTPFEDETSLMEPLAKRWTLGRGDSIQGSSYSQGL